ncbi:hypothetical protein OHB53_08645 [Streptomyces sp. NBC_00056]|uniref:hypothetical protein n=1 Tax=unclassified Streptomyces TaxID=2593676 RepID=UPI0022509E46|nr:hypothetical protein [Streptomyces sp. NBC_00063]MCX5441347.1 hypothetical protein [Streptomyces sp. NBC_00063]
MHTRTFTIPAILAITAIALTACGTQTESGDSAKKPGKNSASPTASKDPSQQFLDWADNGGSESIDTIATDLGAVDEDSHPVDLAGLRESCSTLTADIEAAQGGDPMPDKAMAKRWDLALKHLANSATACTEGSVSEDQTSFDLMASEMDIGIKHLNAVNKHLDELIAS